MTDTTSARVGPVIFSHPTARGQLLDHGVVTTFRIADRTTGATHWRRERTGPKQGDCRIHRVTDEIDPEPALLEPWADRSGFASAERWADAIETVHGDGVTGFVFVVRATDGD